jgi:hypothetical protein
VQLGLAYVSDQIWQVSPFPFRRFFSFSFAEEHARLISFLNVVLLHLRANQHIGGSRNNLATLCGTTCMRSLCQTRTSQVRMPYELDHHFNLSA